MKLVNWCRGKKEEEGEGQKTVGHSKDSGSIAQQGTDSVESELRLVVSMKYNSLTSYIVGKESESQTQLHPAIL